MYFTHNLLKLTLLPAGLSGWGTLRNVVIAMRNIAKQYKPGDRIMLLGYSRGEISPIERLTALGQPFAATLHLGYATFGAFVANTATGAWAARYLATLIDMLGLPKHADEEFFEAVYRAHNNSFTLRLDKDAPWLVKHEREYLPTCTCRDASLLGQISPY